MSTTTTTTTMIYPSVLTAFFKNGEETENLNNKQGAFTFGTIAPGEKSETIIVRLRVSSVSAISNIKIGLISTGGITFANDIFGVTSYPKISNITPATYFQGLNNKSSTNNTISIPNLDQYTSNYVYLNIVLPSNNFLGNGIVRYCWFFDYSD